MPEKCFNIKAINRGRHLLFSKVGDLQGFLIAVIYVFTIKNLTYLLVSVMTIRSIIWTPVCPTRFQFRSPIWSRWCSISTTRLDVTHVLNAGSYPWDGSPKHFLLNNISFSFLILFGLWHLILYWQSWSLVTRVSSNFIWIFKHADLTQISRKFLRFLLQLNTAPGYGPNKFVFFT